MTTSIDAMSAFYHHKWMKETFAQYLDEKKELVRWKPAMDEENKRYMKLADLPFKDPKVLVYYRETSEGVEADILHLRYEFLTYNLKQLNIQAAKRVIDLCESYPNETDDELAARNHELWIQDIQPWHNIPDDSPLRKSYNELPVAEQLKDLVQIQIARVALIAIA